MADKSVAQSERGHKNAKSDITVERLKEVLDYDPKTGIFRWKINANNNGARIGGVAGRENHGRWCVTIKRSTYLCHRLAWLWVMGEWPPFEVDHKDGNSFNNKFKNLRLATSSQNQWNRGKQQNNTSGYKGVYWHRPGNKWAACIVVNRRTKHLGVFDSAEDAAEAYRSMAKKLRGEFAKW